MTVNDIHKYLVNTGMTSLEAAELIGRMLDRAPITVYGWLGNKPIPNHTASLLSLRFSQYLAGIKEF